MIMRDDYQWIQRLEKYHSNYNELFQINLDDFEEEEKQDASYFNFGGFGVNC